MVRTVTPSFPGHCLVKVAGKGLVPMQAIRIGDKVEAYDVHRRISCWSPVTAFMHREPRKSAPYLVLGYSHTLGSGLKECGSVTISADHLVFLIEKGDMVPAGSVQLGQHLLVCHDGHMIMAEASGSMATMGQGFYSPITHIGTIVVDGIVAFAGHQHWWNRLFHRRPDNTPLRYARTPLMVNTPAVVAPVAIAPPALMAPMTPTAGLTRTVYPLSPIATTTYTPTATATTTAFHYPTTPTAMIPMSPTATAHTAMTFQHPASPTMYTSYPAVAYPAAMDTTTTTVQHPTVTDTTHLAYPSGDQQIVTKSTTKTETLTTADVRPVSAPIDFNFDLDGLDTMGSFTTLPATVVA